MDLFHHVLSQSITYRDSFYIRKRKCVPVAVLVPHWCSGALWGGALVDVWGGRHDKGELESGCTLEQKFSSGLWGI